MIFCLFVVAVSLPETLMYCHDSEYVSGLMLGCMYFVSGFIMMTMMVMMIKSR